MFIVQYKDKIVALNIQIPAKAYAFKVSVIN